MSRADCPVADFAGLCWCFHWLLSSNLTNLSLLRLPGPLSGSACLAYSKLLASFPDSSSQTPVPRLRFPDSSSQTPVPIVQYVRFAPGLHSPYIHYTDSNPRALIKSRNHYKQCLNITYSTTPLDWCVRVISNTKVTEKALSKKCRNQSCRDALPAKNTSPKTNETSESAHRKACTDYPHITARCIYRVPQLRPEQPARSKVGVK